MQVFNFLYKIFNDIWTLLFSAETSFGVSLGTIIFGCTIINVLWQFVLLSLGIDRSDFSSLGSPRDYYKTYKIKKQKERAEYARAEARFRSEHNGKLAEAVKK